MGEVIDLATRRLSRSVGVRDDVTSVSPLSRYAQHLRASNAKPRTIRLRLDHARSLAALAPDPELIEAHHIERWMQPPGRKYAAETLKSRRSSARRFFQWLYDNGHIASNPAAKLLPISVIPPPPRVIPDHAMLKALDRVSVRDRAAILLARYACLRLEELSSLRVGNREGDRIRVRGKGDRIRIVYMHPDLCHALHELEGELAGSPWYFPGRVANAHMHPQSMHKIIKRVTGWNPHSLRHAGASAAYQATKDLRAVQLMLGHASLATTQRYLSLDEDALRAVAHGVALESRAALGRAA